MSWTRRSYFDVLIDVCGPATPGSMTVVGIDGRSGSGKTTLASGLAALDGHVVIVHLDDLASGQADFDWADLLIDEILLPLRLNSLPVEFPSPPRTGDRRITIPEGAEVVIVEGVGACRGEVRQMLDAAVWVHVSPATARRRLLAKGNADAHFGRQWVVEETSFLDHHQPWASADLFVHGELGQPAWDGRYGNVVTAPGPGIQAMRQ